MRTTRCDHDLSHSLLLLWWWWFFVSQEDQQMQEDIAAKIQSSALHSAEAIREDFALLESAQHSMQNRLNNFERNISVKLNALVKSLLDLKEGYSLDDDVNPATRAVHRARTASAFDGGSRRASRVSFVDRRNEQEQVKAARQRARTVGGGGAAADEWTPNRPRAISTSSDESPDGAARRLRENTAYNSPSIAVRRRARAVSPSGRTPDTPPSPSHNNARASSASGKHKK